jgi:hypothetical protein
MIKNYYELLTELVAIKSISTDKAFSEEVKKASLWLADFFQDH